MSLSLPFGFADEPLKGNAVAHYFDGLLPDSDAIRRRVAARFRTGSTEAFELLSAIGRDCVGALQLLPEDEEPTGVDRTAGVALDDEAIERHLLEVATPGRFAGFEDPDDFRTSLAGAQEKDAFPRPTPTSPLPAGSGCWWSSASIACRRATARGCCGSCRRISARPPAPRR